MLEMGHDQIRHYDQGELPEGYEVGGTFRVTSEEKAAGVVLEDERDEFYVRAPKPDGEEA